jgi:hypothetical protein
VRNLESAGVSRSAAMRLTGHKTEHVYSRYAIRDEKSLKAVVAQLAVDHAEIRSENELALKSSRIYMGFLTVAEVAKRQTQWTQNPPWVTTWGFKSPPRHQNFSPTVLRFLPRATWLSTPRSNQDRPWLFSKNRTGKNAMQMSSSAAEPAQKRGGTCLEIPKTLA